MVRQLESYLATCDKFYLAVVNLFTNQPHVLRGFTSVTKFRSIIHFRTADKRGPRFSLGQEFTYTAESMVSRELLVRCALILLDATLPNLPRQTNRSFLPHGAGGISRDVMIMGYQ